jgi:hypothetical protein
MVVFIVVVTVVVIVTGPPEETEHRHHHRDAVEDIERWCRVSTSSCETDGISVFYTWIVNATNELGVIVDTRPVDVASCPDVVHPEGSVDRCWRRLGVDHRFSWVYPSATAEDHDHHHDDDDGIEWTALGALILIIVLICVPLACLAFYFRDADVKPGSL